MLETFISHYAFQLRGKSWWQQLNVCFTSVIVIFKTNTAQHNLLILHAWHVFANTSIFFATSDESVSSNALNLSHFIWEVVKFLQFLPKDVLCPTSEDVCRTP